MSKYDVLIVGAGHAGAHAAIALRQLKFAGTVAIIGTEPDLPYERPPLSKEYLAGERPFEHLLIRPATFWAERQVDILLGRTVVGVLAGKHQVELDDGQMIGFSKLIWAAGGQPRSLSCSGRELRKVHHIRTRRDVDGLLAELPDSDRIVVIGGGYIGLEAAAVLKTLGKEVVLLEAFERVLARVAGAPVSQFFEKEHLERGVYLRTGVEVDCLTGDAGEVTAVRLADGSLLPADMVIVGIGIEPVVGPLKEAGAVAGNGIFVDEYCRSSLADIFAIGDCAAHKSEFANRAWTRLESVQNAHDQAAAAASLITGAAAAYRSVPWFWSNQYDLKLQTVGLSSGHDELVVRGDPAQRSFSVIYLRRGRVIALDCINSVKDFVQGKKLVQQRRQADRGLLSDTGTPLKMIGGV